ncbi:hypothetical protein [Lewinella sp. 4G2]|nr:hypothetical protein [Lewinella sp. 4G2]
MFLKFPPILAGNGSTSSYIVLALIIAVVAAVGIFVFRQLGKDSTEG